MKAVKAEVISVGTELLLGSTVDTNAAEAGQVLAECGIDCTHRQTVGDNLARLIDVLRQALSRADIVLTIGGLGPTEDDLTRDGIAAALEEKMILDPVVETWLRELFAQRKMRWVESNLRQAFRPPSATPLLNQRGTAPALIARKGGKTVIALPGPPREFLPFLHGEVRDELVALSGGVAIRSRTLRISGLGESRVEEVVRDLIDSPDPTLAPYAKSSEVHLRMTTRAATDAEAMARFGPMEAAIRERLGWHVYGVDDDTLEGVVLNALRKRGWKLALAESCTGGIVASRITAIPGSSDVFLGGAVSYSAEAKQVLLGVDSELIREFTAVSESVAMAMAHGVARQLGAEVGVSVTGVAGPGPDRDGNPQGLVWLGLHTPEGDWTLELNLGSGRDAIRLRAAQGALNLLWRELQN